MHHVLEMRHIPPGIAVHEIRRESDPETILRINFLSFGNSSHPHRKITTIFLRDYQSNVIYVSAEGKRSA